MHSSCLSQDRHICWQDGGSGVSPLQYGWTRSPQLDPELWLSWSIGHTQMYPHGCSITCAGFPGPTHKLSPGGLLLYEICCIRHEFVILRMNVRVSHTVQKVWNIYTWMLPYIAHASFLCHLRIYLDLPVCFVLLYVIKFGGWNFLKMTSAMQLVCPQVTE